MSHTDLDSCFCVQILNSGAYLLLSQENLINLLFMVVQVTQYTPVVENRFNSLDRIIYFLLFWRLRKLAHPHYSKLMQGLPWCLSGKESTPPIQETQVRTLIWEDPTCWGTTEPVSHNYWACEPAPEPGSTATEACAPSSQCSATGEATPMRSPRTTTESSPCSPQLGKKNPWSNEDPAQPKINK